VSGVDYTWQLGFKKVTAFYAESSATAIAQSLITTYAAANGFTSRNVVAGLPTVSGGITFTDEDLPNALTRLAARIGGYWYVDYVKDLHFFLTDTGANPTDLTASHPTLAQVVAPVSLNQHINRVYVEGRGTTLLAPVAVGETILPVESVDMFTVTSGVFLKASFQGSEGGAQHLTFAGVDAGGGGSMVGPGVTPSSAPTPGSLGGAGVESGVHGQAYTWVTASGETPPSPIGSVTLGALPNPTVVPTGSTPDNSNFADLVENGTYKIKYAYSTDSAEPAANITLTSPASATITANNSGGDSNNAAIQSSIPCSTSPAVARVHVYRTTNGGSTFYRANWFPNVPGTFINHAGTPSDATIVTLGTEPGANTTTVNQIQVTGISIGPTGTTSRKVYRTVAGGAVLMLQQTIANNTATTGVTDSTPDASLGATAPVTDTSALTQASGQIAPGATTMRVAGTAPFIATGGWVRTGGDQIVRYTGLTDTELTGIPASGPGAITAAIPYASTVFAVPRLTGVAGIVAALSAGDEVYLVVRRDDTTSQATLASRLGGDGIREEWIQDRRLSIPEATARGDAFLASRPLDAGSIAYTCRDLNTVSGKDITVNLVAPTSITGVFKIQHVVIANFRPYANQLPTCSVQASAQRFSFEDLLRQKRPG